MATLQITSTLASMRAKQFIVTSTEISQAHENFKRLEKMHMKQPFGLKLYLRPEEMLRFLYSTTYLSAFYILLVPYKPRWQEGLTPFSTRSMTFPRSVSSSLNTTEQQNLIHHGNPGQNITYKSQLALQSSQKKETWEKVIFQKLLLSLSPTSPSTPLPPKRYFSKSLYTLNLQILNP